MQILLQQHTNPGNTQRCTGPFYPYNGKPTETETHHNYPSNSPTYIHILYLFCAPKRAPPGPRTPANQKTSHANISTTFFEKINGVVT
jgi:hypothetical protein